MCRCFQTSQTDTGAEAEAEAEDEGEEVSTWPGGGLLVLFTRTLMCLPEERRLWPSPGDSPELLFLARRAPEALPG